MYVFLIVLDACGLINKKEEAENKYAPMNNILQHIYLRTILRPQEIQFIALVCAKISHHIGRVGG